MKTAMTAIIKKDFRGVTDNKHLFTTMSSDEFKKGQKITLLIIEEGIFTISLGVL